MAAATAHLDMASNPNNLFSIQTSAIAHSRDGQTSKAYELSSLCQKAMPKDETRHLWDLYHCLVCIACGNIEEATAAGKRAAFGAPAFLAPHRQLIGLNASNGHLGEAKRHFELLTKHEPNLSIEQYLTDPTYPVNYPKAGRPSFVLQEFLRN